MVWVCIAKGGKHENFDVFVNDLVAVLGNHPQNFILDSLVRFLFGLWYKYCCVQFSLYVMKEKKHMHIGHSQATVKDSRKGMRSPVGFVFRITPSHAQVFLNDTRKQIAICIAKWWTTTWFKKKILLNSFGKKVENSK